MTPVVLTVPYVRVVQGVPAKQHNVRDGYLVHGVPTLDEDGCCNKA